MKKQIVSVSFAILLVFAVASCNTLVNSPNSPQGPMPSGPNPQDQQPGGPMPQNPQNPQSQNPPQGPLPQNPPQGPQPQNPPQGPLPQGPQPLNPPQNAPTLAPMPGGGGSNPTATPERKKILGIIPIPNIFGAEIDLGVDNIYAASTGHIMATLKNFGSQTLQGSYKLTCSGSYTDLGGNHALAANAQYATINLASGAKADFDTSYSRNPSITAMWVACTVIPPAGDANSGNDSMGMTQVK
jgi:hypothetical protein